MFYKWWKVRRSSDLKPHPQNLKFTWQQQHKGLRQLKPNSIWSLLIQLQSNVLTFTCCCPVTCLWTFQDRQYITTSLPFTSMFSISVFRFSRSCTQSFYIWLSCDQSNKSNLGVCILQETDLDYATVNPFIPFIHVFVLVKVRHFRILLTVDCKVCYPVFSFTFLTFALWETAHKYLCAPPVEI